MRSAERAKAGRLGGGGGGLRVVGCRKRRGQHAFAAGEGGALAGRRLAHDDLHALSGGRGGGHETSHDLCNSLRRQALHLAGLIKSSGVRVNALVCTTVSGCPCGAASGRRRSVRGRFLVTSGTYPRLDCGARCIDAVGEQQNCTRCYNLLQVVLNTFKKKNEFLERDCDSWLGGGGR